jgi:RNA polymerase sigma-70 factor (ECF subfamily)
VQIHKGLDDGELVEAYLKGDKKTWDVLCERYTKELIGFFLNRIGNLEDAEDLTQDTLIDAMVNLSKLRKPENFRGWIYTIARRKLAKWIEHKNRRTIYDSLDDISTDKIAETGVAYAFQAPAHQQPDNQTIAKEHLEIVLSVVEHLPKSEKEVFLLKLADPDMTLKEIAQTLRTSENAVKVRWHRARNKLKIWLGTEYPEEFTDWFSR